jgi:hypothetical protein
MMNIAQTTEERAALAFGTVKNRIRMCGRPAVPSTSARPSETVSIGEARNVPGASENVLPPCSSARLNSSIGFAPTLPSTKIDITTMPAISSTALMICTHVVATMPPKTT